MWRAILLFLGPSCSKVWHHLLIEIRVRTDITSCGSCLYKKNAHNCCITFSFILNKIQSHGLKKKQLKLHCHTNVFSLFKTIH